MKAAMISAFHRIKPSVVFQAKIMELDQQLHVWFCTLII